MTLLCGVYLLSAGSPQVMLSFLLTASSAPVAWLTNSPVLVQDVFSTFVYPHTGCHQCLLNIHTLDLLQLPLLVCAVFILSHVNLKFL